MARDCLNCAHADWQKTAHNPPRINKNMVGKCRCPVENFTIIVPVSVERAYGYRKPTTNNTIWPTDPHQGCQLWKQI